MYLFLPGSSIINFYFFFTFPIMIWYWLLLLYLIPDLLCLQEFNTFIFSKWLNDTLGGEHLAPRSIQIKSCKEKDSQMHPAAAWLEIEGIYNNVIVSILPIPLWKKSKF